MKRLTIYALIAALLCGCTPSVIPPEDASQPTSSTVIEDSSLLTSSEKISSQEPESTENISSEPTEDASSQTPTETPATVTYLQPDPAKSQAYNDAIAAFNRYLTEDATMMDTDVDYESSDDQVDTYALFDVDHDGIPELHIKAQAYAIFSYQDGKLVSRYREQLYTPYYSGDPQENTAFVMENGALVILDNTIDKQWYWYTAFLPDGTCRSIELNGRYLPEDAWFYDEFTVTDGNPAKIQKKGQDTVLKKAKMAWYRYQRPTASPFTPVALAPYYQPDGFYLDQDDTKSAAYNEAVAAFEKYLNRDGGFAIYALYDVNHDGIPELHTREGSYFTEGGKSYHVYFYQDGRVVRRYGEYMRTPSSAGPLENGAVLWSHMSTGIDYIYTTFDADGKPTSVSFSDAGTTFTYVNGEQVSREEYEAFTAPYWDAMEKEAPVVWYYYMSPNYWGPYFSYHDSSPQAYNDTMNAYSFFLAEEIDAFDPKTNTTIGVNDTLSLTGKQRIDSYGTFYPVKGDMQAEDIPFLITRSREYRVFGYQNGQMVLLYTASTDLKNEPVYSINGALLTVKGDSYSVATFAPDGTPSVMEFFENNEGWFVNGKRVPKADYDVLTKTYLDELNALGSQYIIRYYPPAER